RRLHPRRLPPGRAGDARPRPRSPGLRLLAARSGAYRRAMAAIDSPRYAALMFEALAWIETGAWRSDPDPVRTWRRQRPVADFAAEALQRLNRRIRRGGRRLDR